MERNTIERGFGIDVHKVSAVITVNGKEINEVINTYYTFTSSLKEMKARMAPE